MATSPFDIEDDPKDDIIKAPKPNEPEAAIEPDEEGNIELSTEATEDEEPKTETERQQRRKERGRLHKEAEETRAENERLRLDIVRAESARSAAETVARLSQSRAEPQANAVDVEIARVVKQKQHLYDAYNAKGDNITPEQLEQYRKDAAELNDRHDELKHHKFNTKSGVNAPREDPQTAAVRAGLNMMYPDVMANDEARQWALLQYQQRRLGKPAGNEQEDVAEAMRLTRQKYGLKGARPAPTRASQAAYSGSPSGGAGKIRAGGGNGKLVLSKEEAKDAQKMADELYSKQEKDPAKRLARWARTVGPKLLANKRAKAEGRRA